MSFWKNRTVEEPENIRAFNFVTLLILEKLYSEFPSPVEIDGLHTTIESVYDLGPETEEANYLKYLTDTIRWLKTEGFIRYESENQGDFNRVTLTLEGFAILDSVPKSLRGSRSLIQRIKRALSNQSTELMKTLIQELLKGMMRTGGVS